VAVIVLMFFMAWLLGGCLYGDHVCFMVIILCGGGVFRVSVCWRILVWRQWFRGWVRV